MFAEWKKSSRLSPQCVVEGLDWTGTKRTLPHLRTSKPSAVHRTRVDGGPPGRLPSSTIYASRPSRSFCSGFVEVIGLEPPRLALVAVKALPSCRRSSRSRGCSGILKASESRSPQAGSRLARGDPDAHQTGEKLEHDRSRSTDLRPRQGTPPLHSLTLSGESSQRKGACPTDTPPRLLPSDSPDQRAPETMAVWALRLRAQASSFEPCAIGRSLPKLMVSMRDAGTPCWTR